MNTITNTIIGKLKSVIIIIQRSRIYTCRYPTQTPTGTKWEGSAVDFLVLDAAIISIREIEIHSKQRGDTKSAKFRKKKEKKPDDLQQLKG